MELSVLSVIIFLSFCWSTKDQHATFVLSRKMHFIHHFINLSNWKPHSIYVFGFFWSQGNVKQETKKCWLQTYGVVPSVKATEPAETPFPPSATSSLFPLWPSILSWTIHGRGSKPPGGKWIGLSPKDRLAKFIGRIGFQHLPNLCEWLPVWGRRKKEKKKMSR